MLQGGFPSTMIPAVHQNCSMSLTLSINFFQKNATKIHRYLFGTEIRFIIGSFSKMLDSECRFLLTDSHLLKTVSGRFWLSSKIHFSKASWIVTVCKEAHAANRLRAVVFEIIKFYPRMKLFLNVGFTETCKLAANFRFGSVCTILPCSRNECAERLVLRTPITNVKLYWLTRQQAINLVR